MPVGQESLSAKDVAFVEGAVAVAVDQQADTADRRVAGVLGEGFVVRRIDVGIVSLIPTTSRRPSSS
jgi:hypothetical protein